MLSRNLFVTALSSPSSPKSYARTRLLQSSLMKSFLLKLGTAGYRTCDNARGPKKICVTYKPYIAPFYIDHDSKNMTLKRPMSPHLTIYGATLPAMTSIGERATGIMLAVYTLIMAGGTLFLPNGIHSIVSFIQSLDLPEVLIIAIKIVVATSFTFHYFIGLRFVCFNLGKILGLKEAYRTAYISLVLSAITGVLYGLIGHGYSF